MRKAWLGLVAALLAAAVACNSADLKGPTPGSSGSVDPDSTGVEDGGGPPLDGGRDSTSVFDGGTLPVSSDVTIQVQPTDSGAQLLAAIKAAKTSVHMTMYLLTDFDVIKALGDLKAAGKDVKVVLNQNFPQNGGSNQNAFNQLQQRGVSVVWAPPGYQYTHSKTIIIDGEKVIIMTMNLTQSSAATNREYIATDSDPQDVADAETIFDGDFNNTSTTVNGKLVVSPRNASSIDARTRLKALIDSAKTTLDVESQSLSDGVLVDAIILAHQAGVKVRVVFDGNFAGSDAQQEAIAKLKQYQVPVVGLTTPDMHAKAIVVDGERAFVGSMNLTTNALLNNREMGVITDAASEVKKVQDTIAADFAAGSPP